MADLQNVIYLSNEDYNTLVSTGTVTIDGQVLTYSDNDVYITPDTLASATEAGLMSSSDKVKLDGIASGAEANVQADWSVTDTNSDAYIKNKPSIPTVNNGTFTIYSGSDAAASFTANQSGNTNLTFKGSGGTTVTRTATNEITISSTAVTDTNQTIKVGSTTFGVNDAVGLVAGTNITSITADTSAKTITINAKDTTYSEATTSAAGLMSASDKTKLNGIASGAEVNVQSDWNITDTNSDAYIKNKPSIPQGTVTSVATSGTGLSGGTITTSGTITLDSSSAGNAAANKVVLRNAAGSIQTEKIAVSSGTTTKATMQYNDTDRCVEFVFA